MDIKISLGSLIIRFIIERELSINEEIYPFIDSSESLEDVIVHVSWKWTDEILPKSEMLGQDLIQNYYVEDDIFYCLTRGGPKGFIGCVQYQNFNNIYCYINEKPFISQIKQLGTIIRFLPIRAIFQHFQIYFMHASQISFHNRGIVFTGPSGIGKSTQARLWEKHKHSQIICNDRTLLRKKDNYWNTYGYPIDGSSPIRSGDVHQLGAIVLLEKGKNNKVMKLPLTKAITMLLPQLVIDTWNLEARAIAIDQLIELYKDIPIYFLSCTPDIKAVICLEKQLREDGVIDG